MKLYQLVLLVLTWFLSSCAQQDAFYYRYCIDGYDRPINCETGQVISIVTLENQQLHSITE